MIILVGNGGTNLDRIRITTAGNATTPAIDVQANWVDLVLSTSAVTPGRTNTLITSITTTTVVAAPANGTDRTLKSMTVRNRSASVVTTVSVVNHDDTLGAGLVLMYAVLRPGAVLVYDEHFGFRLQNPTVGCWVFDDKEAISTMAVGNATTLVLEADIAANHATANQAFDVRDLGFRVISAYVYYFRFVIMYSVVTSASSGARFMVYGHPNMLSTGGLLRYKEEKSLTTTTKTTTEGHAAMSLPAAANASSAAAATNIAIVEGFYTAPTADFSLAGVPSMYDPVLYLQCASEVAATEICTIKAGSTLFYQRVI